MSTQVLAPSATQLTVSNASSEWDSDMFFSSAKRAAERNIKNKDRSMTRERYMLNRNKLISSVCADYRAHFAAVYGKTERLPSSIFEQVEKAVDKVIAEQLSQINPLNVISLRRGFHVNVNDLEVAERVNLTGENKLNLKEQHLGINIAINAAEKRLTDLQKKPTPDYDREKEMRIRIVKLNQVKAFIEGEIQQQTKAIGESASKSGPIKPDNSDSKTS